MRLPQRLRREQARHADDWLITYADTITLLLCLFVVMLSIKTNGKDLPRNAAVPAVQAVLVTPAIVPAAEVLLTEAPAAKDIFWGRVPFRALTPVAEPVAEQTWPETIVEVTAPLAEAALPEALELQPGTTMASLAVPLESPAPARTETPVIAQPALPEAVDRLKSVNAAVVAQQGNRITTLQISNAAVFGSGFAVLSGAGKAILLDVAATLKSADFAAYRISIEGHTDDSPISTTQFQSNWELSTARAAAVVRFLLDQGIPARKLTAAGYADTFPLAPNRNADGTVIPENQAKNRRVVIKLEKIDKGDQ
jgi:chemotaxis protein MotB